MYKSKTTFIIGAGASYELGFPTGEELKQQIAKAIHIKFEHGTSQTAGSYNIAEALRKFSDYRTNDGSKEYNKYLHAGRHAASSMPQAISIDNFVENQEDDYITKIAKLGIADCIISAENDCLNSFIIDKYSEEINWDDFQKNWIHKFCQTLTEGSRKSKIDELFKNLEFIIFNYDRCVEYFLPKYLSHYYQIDLNEIHEIVSQAKFHHPYGQVGKLDWQKLEMPIHKFGNKQRNELFEISQSILTFSEQVEDESKLYGIRGAIQTADQLVFLGFAFHDSNMDLLQPKTIYDVERVIATAHGISKPDLEVIRKRIGSLCLNERNIALGTMNARDIEDLRRNDFIIDDSATCYTLFEMYRRSLTA